MKRLSGEDHRKRFVLGLEQARLEAGNQRFQHDWRRDLQMHEQQEREREQEQMGKKKKNFVDDEDYQEFLQFQQFKQSRKQPTMTAGDLHTQAP